MDLRETLLAEHSRRQTTRIVEWVGGDAGRLRELMRLFLGAEYRVSQRAAGAVSECIRAHPDLAKPYFRHFLEQLERDDAHVAVRRNVARLLQFVAIPARWRGRIFNACYTLFADPVQPVAVRVFAMTTAANIAKGDPGLLNELRAAALQYPEAATAGLRSRSRRVLGI